MSLMYDKFIASSPRHTAVRTPIASILIHGAVLLLWLAVVARACMPGGLFTWSAGLVYASYDSLLLGFTTWQTWVLLRPQVTRPPTSRPSLGVIIAAHNEAAGLPRTIDALLRQAGRPDVILLADDGSSDGTAVSLAVLGLTQPALGAIAQSSATPGLFWLRLPKGGKAAALNAALPHVTTDIVVTVDADTLAAPGAIATMRAAFAADPDLVAATGVLTPLCAPNAAGRVFQWFQTYEYMRNFLSRFAWMRAAGLLLISGAFAGFRRAAVLQVGGFDEDCLVEDYELIHRLRRHAATTGQAWHTAVLGQCRATTEAPASTAAFLRQRRRWFGGFLQTQFWYRDMVGNPAYGRLGTWMLPVKAADTLQPLFGLTALAVLLAALARGNLAILLPVGGVIGAKILLDLGFHLWSVHLYRRWTGEPASGNFAYALLAAVLEPFSFQLLRHAGASWGWLTFLTGTSSWGAPARVKEARWGGEPPPQTPVAI
jgi:cellulose synthase/poly-beta-1,6-N-acetylglucosamine synthase-like glycosyltransferase